MRFPGAPGTYGEKRNVYRVLIGKPDENNHLKDLCVDGRIILKSILKKEAERV
jgi:hypothetical protein